MFSRASIKPDTPFPAPRLRPWGGGGGMWLYGEMSDSQLPPVLQFDRRDSKILCRSFRPLNKLLLHISWSFETPPITAPPPQHTLPPPPNKKLEQNTRKKQHQTTSVYIHKERERERENVYGYMASDIWSRKTYF